MKFIGYVLIEGEFFIGVNTNSSCEPYTSTYLSNAHIWITRNLAESYKNCYPMKKWKLKKVVVQDI